MKKIMAILLAVAALLMAIGCKPKQSNENITFAATITEITEDGTMVETSADVGFSDALVHLADGYQPEFTLAPGQTIQLTILPMMTKSIPPQVTAVSITLIADALDNNAASVTDGLDPMPMLTPGTEPVTDAEAPDTLEAHMADMLPIMDAITRTMGIEGEQGYLPADAVFVWHVLSQMAENWGHTAPDAEQEDGAVFLPESTLAAFALAAFNRTDALPPLPEELSERVQYDETRKGYQVRLANLQNESVTAIDTFSDNGDGTYVATLGFYTSAGKRLGGVQFSLRDTPAENGVYRYAVTNAVVEKA